MSYCFIICCSFIDARSNNRTEWSGNLGTIHWVMVIWKWNINFLYRFQSCFVWVEISLFRYVSHHYNVTTNVFKWLLEFNFPLLVVYLQETNKTKLYVIAVTVTVVTLLVLSFGVFYIVFSAQTPTVVNNLATEDDDQVIIIRVSNQNYMRL